MTTPNQDDIKRWIDRAHNGDGYAQRQLTAYVRNHRSDQPFVAHYPSKFVKFHDRLPSDLDRSIEWLEPVFYDDILELVTRTYEVDVRLTASQWVTMRVEAFSKDDACDRAQGLALPHGQWEWDEEETYSEAKPVEPEDTP